MRVLPAHFWANSRVSEARSRRAWKARKARPMRVERAHGVPILATPEDASSREQAAPHTTTCRASIPPARDAVADEPPTRDLVPDQLELGLCGIPIPTRTVETEIALARFDSQPRHVSSSQVTPLGWMTLILHGQGQITTREHDRQSRVEVVLLECSGRCLTDGAKCDSFRRGQLVTKRGSKKETLKPLPPEMVLNADEVLKIVLSTSSRQLFASPTATTGRPQSLRATARSTSDDPAPVLTSRPRV